MSGVDDARPKGNEITSPKRVVVVGGPAAPNVSKRGWQDHRGGVPPAIRGCDHRSRASTTQSHMSEPDD